MHYIEYLCILIRKHNVDPIAMLSADDLETIVRRADKKLPPNAFGTPRDVYRARLLQVQYTRLHTVLQYKRTFPFRERTLTEITLESNMQRCPIIHCICYARLHYIEYLVGLIGRHKLDPVKILDLAEICQELRRHGVDLPEREHSCMDQQYRTICTKVGIVFGQSMCPN